VQTVLVVDDCLDIATLEADLVVMSGRRAVIAPDGLEALAILENTNVDIILLDLDMPRLSGQSVLDRLAANRGLSRIPVIVVSANVNALRPTPQVVAVVSKPFDVETLLESIDRCPGVHLTASAAELLQPAAAVFAAIVMPMSSIRTRP
jgi:CheY-like chemotaxis protein